MIQISEPCDVIYWGFLQNWRHYESCLIQCRKTPKTKPVHDLRVRLRKLVATLDILQEVQYTSGQRRLRKMFKRELGSTRELRDFQVQERRLNNYHLPALQEFKDDLTKKRKKEQRRVKNYFTQVALEKQVLAVRAMSQGLFSQNRTPAHEAHTHLTLKRNLINKYLKFKKLSEQVSGQVKVSQFARLHQARIQFKKLRYSWNVLAPLVPLNGEVEKEMKTFQDILGEIQDSTVLLQLVFEFLVLHKKRAIAPEFIQLFCSVESSREAALSLFILKERGV